MSTSITAVNAKLIADAKQFIAEFERAQAGSKKSVDKIDNEMDKLQRSVRKKFTLGGIGKDFLAGLGIGGGFGAAQQIVASLADQWEKAAENAKKVEESTARQLTNTQNAIKARMNDAQREAYLQAEIQRTAKQLGGWKASTQSFDILTPSKWAENFRQFLNDTDKSELATEKINELTEALGALGVELEQLQAKRREQKKAENEAIANQLGAQITRRIDLDQQLTESFEGSPTRAKNMAMINQLYAERALYLKQINELPMTDEKNMGARAVAERNLADTTARLIPLMQQEAKLGFEIGDAIASGFEDAVFAGKKLSDVLNGIAMDILKISFREAITGPIGKAIGGWFNTNLGFRAEGGPVSASSPYIVGEQGPELFVPKSGGTIVPNHAISSRGSGGNVYQIDARGTDESVVQRLQQALFALAGPGVVERRALSAQVSSLRRGGGMGRALQGA